MRFSKQLTACLCVVAMVASGAHADQKDDNLSPLFVAALIGGIFLSTAGNAGNLSTPPPFTSSLGKEEEDKNKRRELYIKAVEAGLGRSSGSIQGITQAGTTVTLHCNPDVCSLGSLNRHATISGAAMMVPAKVYEILTEGMGAPEKASVWLMLAAATWSDEWAAIDANSASALARLNSTPGAYEQAQFALRRALSGDEPEVLVLGAANEEVAAATEVLGDTGTAILGTTVLVIDNTPTAPDPVTENTIDEAANTCGPLTFDC